jgi:hypothetical protein
LGCCGISFSSVRVFVKSLEEVETTRSPNPPLCCGFGLEAWKVSRPGDQCPVWLVVVVVVVLLLLINLLFL